MKVQDFTLAQAIRALRSAPDQAQYALDEGLWSVRTAQRTMERVGFLPPKGGSRGNLDNWRLPEDLTLEKAQWMLYGIRGVVIRWNSRGSWCRDGSNEALEEMGLNPIRLDYWGKETGDVPKNQEVAE